MIKTTTSFLSVRGIASVAISRQDKKRKRAIKVGPISIDPPITTTDIVDEEDDNDKPKSTSKGNTRRASAIPLLTLV